MWSARWLPEMLRSRPGRRLVHRYRVSAVGVGAPDPASLEAAMSALALRWQREEDRAAWTVELPWRTLVYGLVRREVEEVVEVTVHGTGGAWVLEVLCLPKRTHDAHGAGAAGVFALAATSWLLGGWVSGAAAGATTLVAGLLWTDTAREMGMQALERRLRALTTDLGTELWPDRGADLLPPSRPLS